MIYAMNLFAFEQKIETLEHRMYTHTLHKDPSLESLYSLCEKKAQVNLGCLFNVHGTHQEVRNFHNL